MRAQSSGVPLKELSHVKLRRLTREHISKNILKSSKTHNYTRRGRAKGNSMKAVRDLAFSITLTETKKKPVSTIFIRSLEI